MLILFLELFLTQIHYIYTDERRCGPHLYVLETRREGKRHRQQTKRKL